MAVHELGHAIGLAHNRGSNESATAAQKAQVMYYKTDAGESRRYLQGSDYKGMCDKYPGC